MLKEQQKRKQLKMMHEIKLLGSQCLNIFAEESP